ncbi:acetyl/propionyl/methylcrotonyl-CoA carboxylase subunit alpha [Tistrella mobilis]|uniref:Acetyl/propionyl CoA carboxylase alpha subunit n=1 Tax=Tistrella mobilis (strain KA081020-065) TaxID=1110502 RepID=I3TS23_TISMK|nr:biotin carboxylase N-terminal domain-containing protein [Tistrella mobilis]AFK55561.1 acetyl/propionyl CoA carboxylase alpha subunit [Tistrella mobilis KA081020-065]
MFTTVLVANRGEIACRILRTLKEQGIRSVAIHHHVDRNAPHVALADQAVEIRGATPAAAYLDAAAIIEACRVTGAQAVHPGYGFLSENAGFAEAVAAAGLVFIGPDAGVMRLMGDKIRSREFARAAGVPVAPSVIREDDPAGFLDRAARIVGFPMLIKASAGGGGKGMKIVRSAGELAEAARIAAGEALRYFGDDRIYAERLIDRPRHVEVQVLGDGTGRVVHLGERDCSIQRRHQKIVEETPAPGLAPALRDAICRAAVDLASAANYRNAGTVEFVLAPDGAFYFLEMNTRLQVEHPVTEMVLGIDLVAEQLHIAAGGGLRFTQGDMMPEGHAIECRICAEEPQAGFRPATGRIGLLDLPRLPGLRIDGGIARGQEVTAAFDSMLAKIIVHGPDRATAAARLARALDETAILGVATNVDHLARILRHPAFLSGAVDTGFLDTHGADLALPETGPATAAGAVIAAALAHPVLRTLIRETPEPHGSIGFWRN